MYFSLGLNQQKNIFAFYHFVHKDFGRAFEFYMIDNVCILKHEFLCSFCLANNI